MILNNVFVAFFPSRMLSGKVALITGASSGIGAATAVLFSKLGANVSLTGRNVDNLQKTAQACQQVSAEQNQKKPLLIQADLMSEEDTSKVELSNQDFVILVGSGCETILNFLLKCLLLYKKMKGSWGD